jgi:transposase
LANLAPLRQILQRHQFPFTQWKSQLLEGAASVFGGEVKAVPAAEAVDVKTLHAKIGALTLENDFLEGALTKAGLLSARR